MTCFFLTVLQNGVSGMLYVLILKASLGLCMFTVGLLRLLCLIMVTLSGGL